jgi:hypothetical protein
MYYTCIDYATIEETLKKKYDDKIFLGNILIS